MLPKEAPVFALDATVIENWPDAVLTPAMNIARNFLNGESLPVPLPRNVAPKPVDLESRTCATCDNLVILGKTSWDMHVQSRRHRQSLKRQAKRRKEQEEEDQVDD